MPDKLVSSFSRAMFDTNMVSARLILGMSEMLWAVLLWWPGDTFGRPSYTLMSHVMTEDQWGFVFFMTSVAQFGIIASDEFHSRGARWFAAWNATLWVFVVTSICMSVYPPPAAISGELVLAFAAVWIWFRPFLMCHWIINARKNNMQRLRTAGG